MVRYRLGAGNFGHFNLLTLALCVPLLECGGGGGSGEDGGAATLAEAIATPSPLPLSSFMAWLSSYGDSVVYYFFGVMGAINLVFNSWCARSWTFWPVFSGERANEQ